MFKSLRISQWRQYQEVDVTFHPRLTILTGANGAGKTTLLNILSRHTGWSFHFVGTPKKTKDGKRRSTLKYLSDCFRGEEDESLPKLNEQHQAIGQVQYTDGANAGLFVPKEGAQQYQVHIESMRQIPGLYIPSHRPSYAYQAVSQIPTSLEASQQLFQNYVEIYRQTFAIGSKLRSSPTHRMKSSLISLATFGYGNEAVERNEDAITTFEGFEAVLRTVLPPTLGFKRLLIRLPEVVLSCNTGDFSFDAVSGGIAAIIDIAWQIYLCSTLHDTFVVLLDEPENHLHPTLQRRLLPSLLDAFPKASFIAATHNPFVVGSVPDSNVYVLDYDDQQRVTSDLLDLVNRAGSSNEILREVLGVPFTMPVWVETRLEQVVANYLSKPLTEETLSAIKTEMESLGLAHLFPDVLSRVMEAQI